MPLAAPVTAIATERSCGRLGRAAAGAMQGIRNNFEDAHLLDQELGICAVYDGHLGDEAAAFCAERLHLHIAASGTAGSTALTSGFAACDQELRTSLPEGSDAGSTATFAMVVEDGSSDTFKVLVAGCGDSRAVLWHKGSDTLDVTRDHRPSDPEERKRIEAAGGTVNEDFDPSRVDGQLACSRALGAFKFKQGDGPPAEQKVSSVPDVYEWRAQRGDWLVLACDGVWDTFSNERVVQEVCKADTSDIADAVAKTLQLCIDKEADDNLTLLVIELGAVPEEARTVTMTPGNFLKTKDKEVLEQYMSFCLRFGYSLQKEMRPKAPPAAALTATEPRPALPRFRGLPILQPASAEASITQPPDVSEPVPRGTHTPLVIVGPSGVGKGTLISCLMSAFPGRFGFSVSHTTREPRPGEVNGESYHFVDLETMQKELQVPGKFIEHATVHDNLYGTSKAAVEAVQQSGRICVLDIDVQGARLIKESHSDYKFLFIAPPSIQKLEDRLRSRGMETEEKIQTRLSNAKGELNFCEENKEFFNRILVNGDLGVATRELLLIMRDWYPELVQLVKVTTRRPPSFFIHAARELIADKRQIQSVRSAEVEVVGLGNSIPTVAAVLAALQQDGHENVFVETDRVKVKSSLGGIVETPQLRIIVRRLDSKN